MESQKRQPSQAEDFAPDVDEEEISHDIAEFEYLASMLEEED